MNRTIPEQRRKRVSKEMRKEVAERYRNLERMSDIANDLGVSRHCIFKILKEEGVDTSKSQRIERTCATCGKPVLRMRSRARNTNRSFCSTECYHIWLDTFDENYRESSHYSRAAKKIISPYFPFDENIHALHFINNDSTDTRKTNLMVFRSKTDHGKYHAGIHVDPLWDGRK